MNEYYTYTLVRMKEMMAFDFDADLSTSTISHHIIEKL